MLESILVIGISIFAGFIAGNGCVYGFNHLPDSWLGVDEADRHWQRVKSTPWKLVLSAMFIACGMYTGLGEASRAPAVFAAVFILTWIAMAAKLYGVAPRPLIWMLLICGFAILPFEQSFKMNLIGAGVMLALGLGICAAERFLFKKSEKFKTDKAEFMMVLGFLLGIVQGLLVLAASLAAWGAAALIAAGKKKDESGRDLKTMPLSFFMAVLGALWLTINIGHAIL